MTPNGHPILVLAPHPDDETLGCGGTVKLLTRAGVDVDVCFMTRGEQGSEAPEAATAEDRRRLAAVRSSEAQAACRVLGVRQVLFLDGADGRLGDQPHLADALRAVLRAGGYGRVFCPGPQESHPDHVATFRLFRQALRHYPEPLQVWLYEVWTPLVPTICIPIDATLDAKLEALAAHQSQLAWMDYANAFRGLAAYRGLFCAGARCAEAFVAGDRQMILDVR